MEQEACERIGRQLVRQYGTRDPFAIAEGLGIHIYEEDFGRLKGMYRVILKRRCIFLNSTLHEDTKRIVCAHEIGHDRLHRSFAMGSGLGELELYDMTCRREYEANLVAAAILLPDEELLDYIYSYRYDVGQIARAMRSDVNLVALKIDSLRARGYDLRSQEHRPDFLK